jgi:hypothetical protein
MVHGLMLEPHLTGLNLCINVRAPFGKQVAHAPFGGQVAHAPFGGQVAHAPFGDRLPKSLLYCKSLEKWKTTFMDYHNER